MSSELPTPPPTDGRGPGKLPGEQTFPKWAMWALLALLIPFVFLSFMRPPNSKEISYGDFMQQLKDNQVKPGAEFTNGTGAISGELNSGEKFTSAGPAPYAPAEDVKWMTEKGVKFVTPSDSVWQLLLVYLLPIAFFVGFLIWIQRRAQGQMQGIMSVGRSKAKLYSTERPGTTFDDVAGYEGVKQEITEVVDFLKFPER